MTDADSNARTRDLSEQELYPIREVSRLTGINPVTLRAWERRYGLVQPIRTESGHRLYSQANVEQVRSILMWIERGVAVSKVGSILARTEHLAPVGSMSDELRDDWLQWQQAILRATVAFDFDALDLTYGQVFSGYPLAVVFQSILLPVWQQLLREREQFGRSSEWLFLDSFLRGRTLQRLQMSRISGQGHHIVITAFPGQCRELELWVGGLMLGNEDVRVSVLALGQPLDELSLVCNKIQPDALVLISQRPSATDTPRRLSRLAMGLDCPLLLAGELSDHLQEQSATPPFVCLGSEGSLMQRRLRQFLAGHLDT